MELELEKCPCCGSGAYFDIAFNDGLIDGRALAEELGEAYSMFDKEFVLDPIHFAIRFLTKVDAEKVKKEPVAWLVSSRGVFNTHADALQNWKYNGQRKDEKPQPLYLHPQFIPEGYKLVPDAFLKKLVGFFERSPTLSSTNYYETRNSLYSSAAAMLAADPEEKP